MRTVPTLARLAAVALSLAVAALVGSTAIDPPTRRPDGPALVPASDGGERWSQRRDDGRPVRRPNSWFFVERAWPLGEIPRDAWRTAQLQAQALRAEIRGDRESWQLRGPTNVGGRITCCAVDPRDPDVVYAGAAEGGVLRSRNGGQSWDLIFDGQASLSVGAVCLDPIDPDVVYVGTGEVNPGGGSVAYGGVGVFRSPDQGETWQPLGLETTGSIGRIVVDPTDPDRIYVAAMGDLWSPGPDRGVFRTVDGGQTWQRVLGGDEETGCVDLILRPDQPQTLLAALWERTRGPERHDDGGTGCAVWRTDDGGDSWQPVQGGLPVPGPEAGRIGLSLCANQPDYMAAVYADSTGYFDGLYRSTDGGATWSRTSDAALQGVFASYGWWFGNVRCHPTNPNTLFVLGLDFFRTTNGGASWADAGSDMHVDHHGLAFGPGLQPVIYEGNDGGMYRSVNGGTLWTQLPDQPITQVYRLGLDALIPDALYLGGQDISTVRTLSGALDDWETIFGGDGFQPLVHPEDSDRIWAQYQYGNVMYSANGGLSFQGATGGVGAGDRVNWNAPHIQDPTDPDRRYFGTHRVYRNTSSTSWTVISGDLTGGPHQDQAGQVDGTLTAIAVSPLDGEIIWTGSDDGRVHVSASGGAFWSDVTGDLPERWVTCVSGDPFLRERAYVAFSGFRWDEPLPHVFVTENLGQSWTPIAGNLPEAPVNALLPHPDAPGFLLAATDVGVFATRDGGQTWQAAGAGLPSVVVTDLRWSEARRELIAGTFGRSVWALPVPEVTAVPEGGVAIAAPGRLRPAYPNPASAGTTLAWDLGRGGTVTVEIFSVSGRRLWRRVVDDAVKGPGSVFWDGRDRGGRPVAAGVYLARVGVDGRPVGRQTVVVAR